MMTIDPRTPRTPCRTPLRSAGQFLCAGLLAAAMALPCLAQSAAPAAEQSTPAAATPSPEIAMSARLQALYPSTRFGAVNPTPWPGVFEVVMGANIAYVDASGQYFLFGHLYDMKAQRDLTAEHKDTLDFLAGDGKDGRPLGRLRQWGLTVTQIHGGMKIGDRDSPGTRIYAEREFRETAQVLVATEAAGEGINLQFCWFMVNYDIPWNPVRLEQRMGRIHRYGQTKDCLIFNFFAQNTVEGRVLQKLLEKLQAIRDALD